jgi:hypothetical protein
VVVDSGCTGRVMGRAGARDVGGSDGAGCVGTYFGFLWDVHKIRAMTEDDRAVAWIRSKCLGALVAEECLAMIGVLCLALLDARGCPCRCSWRARSSPGRKKAGLKGKQRFLDPAVIYGAASYAIPITPRYF